MSSVLEKEDIGIMDMDYAKRYSQLFYSFNMLASYHNNRLFTDELENAMGFTITCKLNLNNRVVFSFYDRHANKDGKDRDTFVVLYESIHRTTPKRDYKGHTSTRELYPEFGFDFEDDLSPETLFRMIYQVTSDTDNENLLSCFILKILDEIEATAQHFNDLANKAYEYKEIVDEIYDESL